MSSSINTQNICQYSQTLIYNTNINTSNINTYNINTISIQYTHTMCGNRRSNSGLCTLLAVILPLTYNPNPTWQTCLVMQKVLKNIASFFSVNLIKNYNVTTIYNYNH